MSSIQEAIQYGREKLDSQVNNSYQEASLLLAHSLGKTKEFLIAHSEDLVSQETFQCYQEYLSRRAQGEPIAYIQGQKEFWSLCLKVSPEVLIPRPETELLIETTLELLTNKEEVSILDLGTGSGCIALALAKEKPHASITACDISSACIDIAKTNAKSQAINNVNFITSDWFQSIEHKNYDIIISNPPYIAEDDDHIEIQVQKHEPLHALFSDNHGRKDLFHIIKNAPAYMTSGGTLLVEHGYQQGNDVRAQFSKYGYNEIHTLLDIQQHERVTQGTIIN